MESLSCVGVCLPVGRESYALSLQKTGLQRRLEFCGSCSSNKMRNEGVLLKWWPRTITWEYSSGLFKRKVASVEQSYYGADSCRVCWQVGEWQQCNLAWVIIEIHWSVYKPVVPIPLPAASNLHQHYGDQIEHVHYLAVHHCFQSHDHFIVVVSMVHWQWD